MSPKLPRITANELLRALRRDGWEIERHRGSHVQLWHHAKSGQVTIPIHTNKLIPLPVLSSILNQAGLTAEQLQDLL